MFGNIKRKLNDVIQEGLILSENLPSNYLKSTISPSSSSNLDLNNIEIDSTTDIKLTAGNQILFKNEKIWNEIHELNEINANKAKKIDIEIIKIKNKAEKKYIDFTDLNYLLSQIPQIENNLEQCLKTLQIINEQCKICNEKIINLEDLCEQIELQEKQLEHKVQLSKYKQEKMKQLEEVRMKLASQHEENLRKHEESLKKIQKERQAVFQDAFEHDLEIYKERGTLPKVERIKQETSNELSLEDIDLNNTDSQNDLEDFLNEK